MQQQQSQHTFTASEVADYEYCPLAWWHQQFEPLALAENDELFARMVELEKEHGSQATALPEYRVAEQLLVRHGAFEQGQEQHRAHAEEVADGEQERINIVSTSSSTRRSAAIALVLLGIALIVIIVAVVLLTHAGI